MWSRQCFFQVIYTWVNFSRTPIIAIAYTMYIVYVVVKNSVKNPYYIIQKKEWLEDGILSDFDNT